MLVTKQNWGTNRNKRDDLAPSERNSDTYVPYNSGIKTVWPAPGKSTKEHQSQSEFLLVNPGQIHLPLISSHNNGDTQVYTVNY